MTEKRNIIRPTEESPTTQARLYEIGRGDILLISAEDGIIPYGYGRVDWYFLIWVTSVNLYPRAEYADISYFMLDDIKNVNEYVEETLDEYYTTTKYSNIVSKVITTLIPPDPNQLALF